MLGERYVLLGLARPRAGWFRTVAQWATAGALPAEFTKCVSPEELRAHLRSGRTVSAVLLDEGLPAVDRDLLATIRDAGAATLVLADGSGGRDWVGLGATAVLPAQLTREGLLDTLASTATMVARADAGTLPDTPSSATAPPWAGRLAAVCGPGGTGASTAAIALAQGLAADARTGGLVLLADLCLHTEQGMLHDARDVFPGIQELVEAHRSGAPSQEHVRSLAYEVTERGYHLLLGLRQARYWSTLRPQAFLAALASLRSTYQVVVCDVDADFESEDDAGSIDVAERCLPSRAAAQQADVTFAVGIAGMKGVHSLARVINDLLRAGVTADRIQPVFNTGPRHPRRRTEVTAALAELTRPAAAELAAPVFLPRRNVGAAHRDGVGLPTPLPQLLAGAWHGMLARNRTAAPAPPEGEPVRPGTVGSWTIGHEEAAGA